MYKQITMVFVTVLAIAGGVAVSNAQSPKREQVMSAEKTATDTQQKEFRDKFMKQLKDSQDETFKQYQAKEVPNSTYARIFPQSNASAVHPNSTTFDPQITGGGLNYNGTAFSITVDNHSSLHDEKFVVNGKYSENGTITEVKVDAYE